MNPKENNPMSAPNAGGVGASSFGSPSSPVDFTGGTGSASSGLSMADSLASAQDNLTSAGLAAQTPDSGAIGLSQLGASDPSASMARPSEPLVPADPVPGSIGSVTSVPPVSSNTADTTPAAGFGVNQMGTNMAGASTTMGAASASSAGNASMTSAGSMGATSNAGTGSAGSASTTGVGAQSYYNPFAQTGAAKPVAPMTNNATHSATASAGMPGGATSSATIPPALQPAAQKFSAKNGKSSNLLTIILGGLSVLFLVMAIIFAVLWQQAANSKEIVYVPSNPQGGNTTEPETQVQELTCTQPADLAGLEALQNLTNFDRTIVAQYQGDDLKTINLRNAYTFVDNAAAELARGYFDEQTNNVNSIALTLGIPALTTQIDIVDNVLNYNLSGTADQMVGDYAALFLLGTDETGAVRTALGDVQPVYEGAGFVCEVVQK